MITNLDRQCIDHVVSSAISVICFYGLEEPERRNTLRQHLLEIIESTSVTVNNQTPGHLPEHIKLAFHDITAYLYSDNPRSDFFLLGKLAPTLNEIQTYILNMLRSVSFYLDDNPNTQTSNIFPKIDIAVKQILRAAYVPTKNGKKNITFQQAMDHAQKALFDEQNITVYKQIKKPVAELLNTKNNLNNAANTPQRIVLDQRLFLLDLLNNIEAHHYRSTGPGTRGHNTNQINEQLNLPPDNDPPEPDLPTSVVVLIPSVIIIGILFILNNFNKLPAPPRPSWPAGMTDLSNSAAHLNSMGKHVQYDSVENITFPFIQYFDRNYPLLTIMSFDIYHARNYANHEDLTYGLSQMRSRTYSKLIDNRDKLIDTYAALWAFFAEHGRNVTRQASHGITIPLTSEQAHDLRALEALRVGLETLIQAKYPKYHSGFSCNNYQNPLEQMGALNDLIKLEFESQHNLYNERVTLFYDWLYMIKEYNINYPDYPKESIFIREYQSINIPSSVIKSMLKVMDDKNCPWWQEPLGRIKNTVGTIQNTLCDAWKNTMPNLQTNRQRQRQLHAEYQRNLRKEV